MLPQIILIFFVSCFANAQENAPALVTAPTPVSIKDYEESRSKDKGEMPTNNMSEPFNPASSVSGQMVYTPINKEPQIVSTKPSKLTTKAPINAKPTRPATNTPVAPSSTTASPPPTAVLTSSQKGLTSPKTSPASTNTLATSSGGSTVTSASTTATTGGSCKVSTSDVKLLVLLLFSIVLFMLL